MQNRVPAAEGITHGFIGVRVRNPLAVHHEAVFVGAGRQRGLVPPIASAGGVQRFGLRLPVAKRSSEADALAVGWANSKRTGVSLRPAFRVLS
jgi:hypothetical protein